MESILILLALLIIVVVFDLVALKWGADSRDSMSSLEWSRRYDRQLSL